MIGPFPEGKPPGDPRKAFPSFPLLERYSHHTEKFIRFHHAYPEVWWAIVRIAESRRVLGFDHYSIRAIKYIVLYEQETRERGKVSDKWAINNNHTPYYARIYEHLFRCPGFFQRRRSVADELDLSHLGAAACS